MHSYPCMCKVTSHFSGPPPKPSFDVLLLARKRLFEFLTMRHGIWFRKKVSSKCPETHPFFSGAVRDGDLWSASRSCSLSLYYLPHSQEVPQTLNGRSLKGTIKLRLYVFKNELTSTLVRFPPTVCAPWSPLPLLETGSHVEQADL